METGFKKFKRFGFETKVVLCYVLATLLVLAIGIVSLFSIRTIIRQKDDVNDRLSRIILEVERLRYDAEAVTSSSRIFL